MTHRRWVLPVALVVAVAVVATAATWLTQRRGQPAGTLVAESDLHDLTDADELPDRVVLLPTGQLTVRTSRPLRELPGGVGEPGVLDRVGGFGRWVAIGWELRPSVQLQGRQSVAAQGSGQRFTVVAVADGVRHDLRAGTAGRDGAVYLALPDEPDGFTVEVGFAGVTQVLDPRTGDVRKGAAAPLYERSLAWSTRAPACALKRAEVAVPGFGAAPGEDLSIGCEVGAGFSVPYVAGAGWAPAGRTWLVLRVTTRASAGLYVNWPSFEARPNVLYVLKLKSSSLSLGTGATPTTTLPVYGESAQELLAGGVTAAYYVFDVAPDRPVRAVLRQLYADDDRGANARPDAPRGARATLTIPVDLAPPA